jgi:hypothetical protein
MTLAAAMEDLQEDAAAFRVYRLGDCSPTDDVLGKINAGRAEVRAAGDRNCGGLCNQKAAGRSALSIEIRHHRQRRVKRVRSEPRHWCKDDAMRQRIRPELTR